MKLEILWVGVAMRSKVYVGHSEQDARRVATERSPVDMGGTAEMWLCAITESGRAIPICSAFSYAIDPDLAPGASQPKS